MFRGLFFDFFKKKEEKPESYSKGPYKDIVIIPHGTRYRVLARKSAIYAYEELGIFKSVSLDAANSTSAPLNECIGWLYWDYHDETEPAEPSIADIIQAVSELQPSGMVSVIVGAYGYKLWVQTIDERLYFIVWPEE